MEPEEIEKYIFNDPALDSIKDFDLLAREALIKREITKSDYLKIEQVRQFIEALSPSGKIIFKEIMSGL